MRVESRLIKQDIEDHYIDIEAIPTLGISHIAHQQVVIIKGQNQYPLHW